MVYLVSPGVPRLALPGVYNLGFLQFWAGICLCSSLVTILGFQEPIILLICFSVLVLILLSLVFIPARCRVLSWTRLPRFRRGMVTVLLMVALLGPLLSQIPFLTLWNQRSACPPAVLEEISRYDSGVVLGGRVMQNGTYRLAVVTSVENPQGVRLWAATPWVGEITARKQESRITSPAKGGSIFMRIRMACSSLIRRSFSGADTPEAGVSRLRAQDFLAAVLLGDRSRVHPELELLFRQAGVLHVLALSGFHLGLLSSLLLRLGRGFAQRSLFCSRLISLCMMILVGGFCFIALPGPGLFRAGLMFVLTELWFFLRIPIPGDGVFFISMGVLLVLNPWFLLDWGFYLSFLALWGIIKFQAVASRLLVRISGRHLAGYLAPGLSAVWWTIPFFLAVGGEISLNGIILSPILGILLGVWIYGGLLVLLTAWALPMPSWFMVLFSRLEEVTETVLLRGRLIPPVNLEGWPLRVIVGVMWLGCTLLLWNRQSWYPRHQYDSIQLTPGAFTIHPRAGTVHEKAIRSKLHGGSRSEAEDCGSP